MTEQGKPLTEAFIRALYTQGPDVLVFNLAERGMIEPEPVDPLLEEVEALHQEWIADDGDTLDFALACLRRGKELRQAAARPLTRDIVREAARSIHALGWMTETDIDRFHDALVALTQQMDGRDG